MSWVTGTVSSNGVPISSVEELDEELELEVVESEVSLEENISSRASSK
jgi:hypothetical protein